MLLVAINPGTFQEMVPLLALFPWKNENHNIGIRKILEIDKSKLLFGGRLWFWFSPPETERGPVWFSPRGSSSPALFIKIGATMLSPLKNQVPRCHDSPQLEPKGLLLACLGGTLVLMTYAGSESAPVFQSFTSRRAWYALNVSRWQRSPRCWRSLRGLPWAQSRGWAKGRDQLWPGISPPALLLSRSLFMPVVSAETLSRKVFWGTFSNRN